MKKGVTVDFNPDEALQELLDCGEVPLPLPVLTESDIVSAAAYKDALTMLAGLYHLRRKEPINARSLWWDGQYPDHSAVLGLGKLHVTKIPSGEPDLSKLWQRIIDRFTEIKGCVTGLNKTHYGGFELHLFGAFEVTRVQGSRAFWLRLTYGVPSLELTVGTLFAFIEAIEQAFGFPGWVERSEWDVGINFLDRDEGLIASLGLRGDYSNPEEQATKSGPKLLHAEDFAVTAKVPLLAEVAQEVAQG